MRLDPQSARVILATDCGSTTTKAILIEKRGDEYRLVCRGEAPTTVEAPFEDVTIGVLNAIAEVEELSGRTLLRDGAGEPGYLLLDEAVRQGLARVTEVSAAGSVPELKLVNDADRPVLLLDGEELVGAKQNRIVNLSILVPA